MSQDNKKEDAILDPPLKNSATNIPTSEKNKMFMEYVHNVPLKAIAKKYGFEQYAIVNLYTHEKWKVKRDFINKHAFEQINKEMQKQAVSIVAFLRRDINMLMENCKKQNRTMDKDERRFLLDVLEKYGKNERIMDDKPIEQSTGGVVKHEVILPPTVTNYNIIPIDNDNITYSNKTPEKAQETKNESDDLQKMAEQELDNIYDQHVVVDDEETKEIEAQSVSIEEQLKLDT